MAPDTKQARSKPGVTPFPHCAISRRSRKPDMASSSQSTTASRLCHRYLEEGSRIELSKLISAPALKVSAGRKPRRVQDLLDDTAASRFYERFGSQSAADASPHSPASTSSNSSVTGKQSRYLRESDRCSIIHRIAAGEKQAMLAREFGVTRAAICHINKNRVEILARSLHRDARHPKRPRYKTISKPLVTHLDDQDGQPQLPIVYEVRSMPMAMILTALRSKETRPRDFRHFADRAIRLLLEEALACAEMKTIELVTPSECVCEGVQSARTSCGIALGDEGFPMLESFRAIHPDNPAGYVMEGATSWPRWPEPTGNRAQLPPNLERHPIFIMVPTCPSAEDMCTAMQTLLDMGAQESSVFFVCIVMSAFATSIICSRYPGVRIVTAAIDPDVNGMSICPGIGDFRSRYFVLNASATY